MLDQLCAADFDTLPQRLLGATFDGTARMLEIVEIQPLLGNGLRNAHTRSEHLDTTGYLYLSPSGAWRARAFHGAAGAR